MTRFTRMIAPVALAALASGCSLGSILGGGGKAPAVLYTLTSTAAPGATSVWGAGTGGGRDSMRSWR